MSPSPASRASAPKSATGHKSALTARFSPLSLMRIVWKGKLFVLLLWVAATGAGAFIAMRLKPTYRAQTLILVESQKIPDKYVASTVMGEVQDRLATINQEILSTTRLKKIIDDYKLYSDSRQKKSLEEIVETMRGDVEVRLEKGWSNNRPGAFRISYEGSEPTVVAAVVNRLASLYIDENLKVREVQAEGTSQFLDAQLKEAKRTLDELEAAVSRYKLQHNGELPQQENTINAALMRLQTELQGTQDAISRALQNKLLYDTELSTLQSQIATLVEAGNSAERPGPARTNPEPTPAAPVKPSDVLTAQLKALRTRYSDEHPEVKRVKAALAESLEAEQQQAAAVRAARPAEPVDTATATPPPAPRKGTLPATTLHEMEQLQQRVSSLQAQRTIAVHNAETAEARRESILKEMGAYQKQMKNLPIREQEMAALTRDYEMAKGNYRSLLDKKTSADLATDMEHRQKAERFMVLDPAQPPEKPFKPNRPLTVAATSLVGLALGLGVAFAKEWKKDLLLGEWELPAGVPVLGRIPLIDIAPAAARPRRSRKIATQAVGTTATTLLALLLGMF